MGGSLRFDRLHELGRTADLAAMLRADVAVTGPTYEVGGWALGGPAVATLLEAEKALAQASKDDEVAGCVEKHRAHAAYRRELGAFGAGIAMKLAANRGLCDSGDTKGLLRACGVSSGNPLEPWRPEFV